jgi:hypothetical protein
MIVQRSVIIILIFFAIVDMATKRYISHNFYIFPSQTILINYSNLFGKIQLIFLLFRIKFRGILFLIYK